LKKHVETMLEKRGIKISDIAEIVFEMQKKYLPVNMNMCVKVVESVMEKHEVQNAILTGIALDIAAEKKQVDEPLLSMLLSDEPLYGVDEILSLSITNIYGSIALTNFGYIDKLKIGILTKLNQRRDLQCNTFLDDLVAAVAAAACSKLAHSFEKAKKMQGKN
jgi:phosphatidylglycerophosphatase A